MGVHPLLQHTAHRPWPLPSGRWVMKQVWHDLLFAHWPLPPEQIRPLVPKQLPLDIFDGKAWVGVVPFWMSGVRGRGFPPIPGLSRFPELNLRTYVTIGGKPGVYFFSLDITSHLAVWAARAFFSLPYFHASMSSMERDESIYYSSQRDDSNAEFAAVYRPTAPPRVRESGSLADFLTARFCLYTVRRERVYRCEIHHLPWPLQDAKAEIQRNTIAAAAGIMLPDVSPLLHFSRKLEVLVWPLRPLD